MKRGVAIMLICIASARAEIHTIGVDLSRAADKSVRVSLTSVVPAEAQRNVSVERAAEIIRTSPGSGSTIVVGIVVRDAHPPIQLYEYLPLFIAIAQNRFAELAFLDTGNAYEIETQNMRKEIRGAK